MFGEASVWAPEETFPCRSPGYVCGMAGQGGGGPGGPCLQLPSEPPKPCCVQGLVGGRLPSEACQLKPLSLPVAGLECTQGGWSPQRLCK